jgi:hypothetical protein
MSGLMPENSAIKLTKAQEIEISKLESHEEIKTAMRRFAVEQSKIRPDEFDPEGQNYYAFRPVEQSAQTLSKTINLNGRAYTLSGTAEDLTRQETELYRQVLAQPAATTEQPRDITTGRFVAAPTPEEQAAADVETARQNELQLQLSLSQITMDEYLDRSGTLDRHLDRRAEQITTRGWERASEEFRDSEIGKNWPGGVDMRERLSRVLADHNLMATGDKLAALQQAWQIMQLENYEVDVTEKLASATDFQSIKNAVGYRDPDPRSNGGSGGFWGR